jgi:hypothetical protein
VRIGPRNRRRLAIGGAFALAVAIAAAAAALFTGSSRSGLANPPSRQLVALTAKVVDGMSKQEVLHVIGKPASSRGRCWQYPVAPGPRAPRRVVETVVSVCFYADHVSDMSSRDYIRRHGKLVPLPQPRLNLGG